jgi:NAD(P)-dependent dehydrogenase (short-subunit alcohol dehydrogenase family)
MLINYAKWNMSTEAVLRMSKQDVRTSTGGLFVGATDKPLGQGSIVNISSGAGVRGHPALAAYCASKHGVNGLTKAMSKDWPNVRINAVAPGKYGLL